MFAYFAVAYHRGCVVSGQTWKTLVFQQQTAACDCLSGCLAVCALYSRSGDDLAGVEADVVVLRDEDGGDGLVERRAVHVDGGADRKHEACDGLVHTRLLLDTLESHGQRGRAEANTMLKVCLSEF